MGNNLKYRKSVVLTFLRIVFLSMICFGCSAPEKDKKEVKHSTVPVNIAIYYTPGAAEKPSVITLNLFSRTARQTMYDNIGKEEEKRKEIKPVTLSIKKDFWERDVSFHVTGEIERNIEGVELIDAPKITKIILGPEDTITARYKIPPSAAPSPGEKLHAKMKIDKYTITSNKETIPELPADEGENLLRQAVIESGLNEYGNLLQTAEKIISQYPESSWGYWYKGKALEGRGNFAEALKSYQTALEKVPIPKEGEYPEPPMPIITKIRELKRKL